MKKFNIKPGTKNYVWNPIICTFENDEYLGNIISDVVVTCDQIREATKKITKKFQIYGNIWQ